MKVKNDVEKTTVTIASLGKNELKKRIRDFHGRFKLDFTDEYLSKLSIERLRHILLAAVLNTSSRS
ncbi:MAG: hypothetical protein ACYTFM_07310 [Planctomycetota bacterium]|jgi:hypothetical protein